MVKQRKRPKIGDILEIETPKGFAYMQYTHKHFKYGTLIRVLPGIFKEHLSDFSRLVNEEERFLVFFPVGAAANREIVSIVGHEEIPAHLLEFPLMRMAGGATREGKILNWWLFDGVREWRIDALKPEHHKLSIVEGWNDTLIIERITSGWTPDKYI